MQQRFFNQKQKVMKQNTIDLTKVLRPGDKVFTATGMDATVLNISDELKHYPIDVQLKGGSRFLLDITGHLVHGDALPFIYPSAKMEEWQCEPSQTAIK
jgi:hypothetical protein